MEITRNIPPDTTLKSPELRERYVSTKFVARLFSRHQSTVCDWCRDGLLDAEKVGTVWLIRRTSRIGYPPALDEFKLEPPGPKPQRTEND